MENDAMAMVSAIEFLRLNAEFEGRKLPSRGVFMLKGKPIQYALGNPYEYAFGCLGEWIRVESRPSGGRHNTIRCSRFGD